MSFSIDTQSAGILSVPPPLDGQLAYFRRTLAERDAEIAELRGEISRLLAENDRLGREIGRRVKEVIDGPARREWDFTLTLVGVHELTEDLTNVLFEATGGDCTPSSCNGQISVGFTRSGDDVMALIHAAGRQVMRADPRITSYGWTVEPPSPYAAYQNDR